MKPIIMLISLTIAISSAQEKTSVRSAAQPELKQSSTLININRIAAWYESNGQQERDPVTGNAGVTYPRGTSTAIYAGGILWGGLVHDGILPELRVNGQSYAVGTTPGAILGIRTGKIEDALNNVLRDRPPTPTGPPPPPPFINPITKSRTNFWFNGDPVLKTGWIDGLESLPDCINGPGDSRLLMSSGPFEMALGDTQEAVYALVGGLGSDRLSSITAMKFYVRHVKNYFDFSFPDNPSNVGQNNSSHPTTHSLSQNFPNPFNPQTTIEYQIPKDGFVTLKVYDMLGREAAVLVNEQKSSGRYSVEWNASVYPSGVYFYRLSAGLFSKTQKIVLLK